MPPPRDETTTPPALRLPALGLLVALMMYLGACYHHALSETMPAWSYLGQWSMFTMRETWHTDLGAIVEVGGKQSYADLEALFPSRWDSGPRYVRGPFRSNPQRVATLAQAVCRRSRPYPARVIIGEYRWRAKVQSRRR